MARPYPHPASTPPLRWWHALGFIVLLVLAIGSSAALIALGHVDDAPGAGFLGFLLMAVTAYGVTQWVRPRL